MQFIITEEEINNLVEKWLLDESSKGGKVWGLKDELSHIANRYVKMTPEVGSILFDALQVRTFHVTNIDNIDRMKTLASPDSKRAISSFSYMDKGKLRNMEGIETEGGIIYELIGEAVFKGTGDIMSVTDQRYRRWLPSQYVIPTNLQNEFTEAINTFKNNNFLPSSEDKSSEDKVKTLRYIVIYGLTVNSFIEKHKDEIKKFVRRDVGGSYDEILIHKFKVNDVLLTMNRVRNSSGEYGWMTEYNRLKEITNVRNLNTDEIIRFKVYRDKFKEIQNKLQSFAEGTITLTDDTNVALTWVKERGGTIDREEFRNKIKDLTENKTNKKMKKKIKISESQLKTIMERRHTYAGDTNEEQKFDIDQLNDKDQEKIDVTKPEEMKEQDFGMSSENPNDEMGQHSEGEDLSSKVENFKNKFKEIIALAEDLKKDLPEEHQKEQWQDWTINNLIARYGGEDSPFGGQTTATICDVLDDALGINHEEEDEDYEEEDSLMNESIKNIRNNFKRFL